MSSLFMGAPEFMLMGDSGWGLAMKKAPPCDSKIRALGHGI